MTRLKFVGEGLTRLVEKTGCTGWALRRYLIVRLPRNRWLILGAAVWTRDPLLAKEKR